MSSLPNSFPVRLRARDLFLSKKSEPSPEGLLEAIHPQDAPKECELTAEASSEPSTDSLIQRIQHEDREAFAILFRRYSRLVVSLGYRVLGTYAEAEDLVQDVFLYIWTRCKSLKPHEHHSMHDLVIRVIYHRAFDRRRYLMSRLYWHGANGDEKRIDKFAARNSTTCKLADSIHRRRLLESAFTRLSPRQQRVLRLYYYEGFSLREISEKIEDTFDNVRNHWARGIQRLRECVRINDWDGD